MFLVVNSGGNLWRIIATMASGVFEDEAEGTITINEYIERLDAEELVMFSFSSWSVLKLMYVSDPYESLILFHIFTPWLVINRLDLSVNKRLEIGFWP